ncbi:FtsX-like permease family protein [Actinocatenispora rupis]|uniref:ABC3 transporter permease C-terminal domain-containing protein n=1 Tax=Actinocatenispora rupis TaxID=519421 RepID=A0A8J3NFA4_9ACTN|nr:FtsX-like permease family protein [Actinocatenispora rupis]GID14675.1 hypothetical protein Aru02nite_55640 [Actinocatenispora rupis]
MSAVWVACRAAVRRRRLQTVVVGVVVGMAALTLVFALGLLSASHRPFEQAFAAAHGAHLTATYDPTTVTDARLRATRTTAGVTAAAGPYHTATLPRPMSGARTRLPEGTVLVGRASPGGPVDTLTLRAGRWARSAGEVVVGADAGRDAVGQTLTGQGLPTLTVVGVASSATGTASAWVTPAQVAAYPTTGVQMLYRFADAGDATALQADLARVRAGLPSGALLGSENYLAVRQDFQKQFDQILPFVTVFGALAAVVALIIILNVVSGAVVAGVRTIGVMKAIGFTPVQSTAVYVGMVAIPAVVGCLVGDAVGSVLGTLAVRTLGADLGLPALPAVDASTALLAAVTVLAAVVGTALVPSLRAGRLPAARAISPLAGARAGRFRRVQRFLAARSLPTPVGLGLSLPFARPARTALTLVTVVLGALTVTLSTGLHDSVTRITSAMNGDALPIVVQSGDLTRAQVEARLRALPGTAALAGSTHFPAHLVGIAAEMHIVAYRGDSAVVYRSLLSRGRWFAGADEVVVSEAFLRVRHHRLGDTLQLTGGGRRVPVRIVGTVFDADSNGITVGWATATALGGEPAQAGGAVHAPRGSGEPLEYSIALAPGTDPDTYQASLRRAFGSALTPVSPAGADSAPVFDGLFLAFTVLLCVSAALGVLNTAVLDTRERARDLGILKSIGMTPRQVVAMVVVSMGALGAIGGLLGIPLGVLSHHRVLALTGDLIETGMPAHFVTVYRPVLLVLLCLAGPVIGVLGALLPAARAGRMSTAPVLRSE